MDQITDYDDLYAHLNDHQINTLFGYNNLPVKALRRDDPPVTGFDPDLLDRHWVWHMQRAFRLLHRR